MSDCSPRAWRVPNAIREIPEPPTLRRIAELNGEPPWALELPWPAELPEEAAELIGEVDIGGARFTRADEGPI